MRLVAAQPVAPATASPACLCQLSSRPPSPSEQAARLDSPSSSVRLSLPLTRDLPLTLPTNYAATRKQPQSPPATGLTFRSRRPHSDPASSFSSSPRRPASECGSSIAQPGCAPASLARPVSGALPPFSYWVPARQHVSSSLHSLLCLWLRAETRLPALPMGPGPPALPLHRRGGPRQHG